MRASAILRFARTIRFAMVGSATRNASAISPVVSPPIALRVLALVKAADEEGLETAWVLDHFQTVPPSRASLFECWTLVTSFLRETQRLRIGQLVTGNSYRN